MSYKISLEELDALGAVRNRAVLSERFETEEEAGGAAARLAAGHEGSRYSIKGGFWTYEDRGGTHCRIVIVPEA